MPASHCDPQILHDLEEKVKLSSESESIFDKGDTEIELKAAGTFSLVHSPGLNYSECNVCMKHITAWENRRER